MPDPKKYYLFQALPGGLVCRGYTLENPGGDQQELVLKPDLPGETVKIHPSWVGRPCANELWTDDPDPYKAHAKMLAQARSDADNAEKSAKMRAGVLSQVRAATPEPYDEPKAKKPPKLYVEIIPEFGKHGYRLYLADLMAAAGIADHPAPDEIRLGIIRDGLDMYASTSPREADYPGITVDAHKDTAGDIWLGNFEMPCETYPQRIAARLYAGCSKFETDEPIAIATHEITDDARILYRVGQYGSGGKSMRKLVYIDVTHAAYRPWLDAGEDAMPEHIEDETGK